MYYVTQRAGVRSFLTREAVPLIAALAIAEIYYKLGSFLLECVAFLATWAVLSALWSAMISLWGGDRSET